MRDLKITLGSSADAFIWNNSTISWDELCEKLKTTRRTAETVEQYHAMSRDEKEKAKDIGGFVGGHLKNSRRLAVNMICRSMLTLDSDSAKTDFLAHFKQNCCYAAVVYTTHGHTPEAPRYRNRSYAFDIWYKKEALPPNLTAKPLERIILFFSCDADPLGLGQFCDKALIKLRQLIILPMNQHIPIYPLIFRAFPLHQPQLP